MADIRSLILRRLEAIRQLPTLPEVVSRIDEVTKRPDSSLAEIAVVIESDPSIAAAILKLANSAYYQTMNRRIASLGEAISRLGLAETRKLCLAFAVMRLFVRPSRLLDHRNLWRHCGSVATAARVLCARLPGHSIDSDEAFVAGLLHEIGTLLLDQYFDKIFALIQQRAQGGKRPVHLIEREALTIDHAEIGAWLLDRWGLPESIVAAIT